MIVAHEHNWSYSGNRRRIWIDREIIGRLATRFVAVSQANRTRMINIERIPPEKIVVLPTAHIPDARVSSTDLRSERGLPPGSRLIGIAAVRRAGRALDVLIEANAKIRRRTDQVHLVIAGEGPCRGDLERRISDPPRGPAAFAEALLGVLSDPHRREQPAAAAADRIGEFTIESVAGKFACLYDELLATAAASDQRPLLPQRP